MAPQLRAPRAPAAQPLRALLPEATSTAGQVAGAALCGRRLCRVLGLGQVSSRGPAHVNSAKRAEPTRPHHAGQSPREMVDV